MGMNLTDAYKLIRLEADTLEEILLKFGDISRAVSEFNGKVLNKRLDTKLKSIDKHLRADIGDRLLTIDYYVGDKRIQSEGYALYSSSIYLHDNYRLICREGYIKPVKTSDGKFIAQPVLDEINRKEKAIDKYIDELREKSEHINEYKEWLDENAAQRREYLEQIPYDIQYYCQF